MPLPKRAYTGNHLETEVLINVFDLKEKGKIIFTGSANDVARFIGISSPRNVLGYITTKSRCKKKYALRYAKQL